MALQELTARQRHDMSAAAMRTYPNIVRDWGLQEAEAALLLGVSESTYRHWRKDPEHANLDVNHLERMSLILGIYRALQILYPRPESADAWLQRPNRNPLFAGSPPLERLRSGLVQDLYFVRQHLNAALGGGYS
ncbi:antitoxin Xre-like helix-turn-helix domain-containing protein [Halomonas mongoliensis]|uniref:antitoxin Xre-like helix-turn-helix domain-containing protein n=1 Tax=Halomonas mongoliensis TaxID=321265 RepID=UPI00403B2556